MTRNGNRVAHRELDDEILGTAKTGTVEEVIDLGDQALVATRFDDGEAAIYDRREVVDLGPKASTNQTPVILKKRHALALVRKRMVILCGLMMISFLTAVALALSALKTDVWVSLIASVSALAFMAYALSKLLSTEYLISKEK